MPCKIVPKPCKPLLLPWYNKKLHCVLLLPYLSHSSILALDKMPPPQALQQVAPTGLLPPPTPTSQLLVIPVVSTSLGSNEFTALNFSLVPPVPTQLVDKIEAGNFVDMAELLSDHMRVLENEDHPKSAKSRRHNVTSILEWARCFALYISIISRKQPQRVPDLLGYQSLILLASMAYEGDGWQGYDRIFRQHTAVRPSCK